jgi:hypothetical protein
VFERFRTILPGGEICQTYQPTPNMATAALTENGDRVSSQHHQPTFVAVHTSRGFAGYVEAPASPKKRQRLNLEAEDKRDKLRHLLAIKGRHNVWLPPGMSFTAAADDVLIPGVVGPPYYRAAQARRESDQGKAAAAAEQVKNKTVGKFGRRRCKHCGRGFAKFLPWIHHNCLTETAAAAATLACKICGKEFPEEKALFGHCSASPGKRL